MALFSSLFSASVPFFGLAVEATRNLGKFRFCATLFPDKAQMLCKMTEQRPLLFGPSRALNRPTTNNRPMDQQQDREIAGGLRAGRSDAWRREKSKPNKGFYDGTGDGGFYD